MGKVLHIRMLVMVGSLLGLAIHTHAQSAALSKSMPKHLDKKTFLSDFSFKEYLVAVAMDDFQTLQKDREFLNVKGLGDAFLYYCGNQHLVHNPLTSETLPDMIQLGEAYLAYKAGISPSENELYRNMGYFFLGKAANHLSKGIAAGTYAPNDAQVAPLLGRLMQRQIYTTISKSKWDKLWENMSKGNYGYVARRLALKFETHWIPYQHLFGARQIWPLFLALLLLSALIFAAFKRKRLVIMLCSFFVIGPLFLGFAGMERTRLKAAYTMSPYRFLHHDMVTIDRIACDENKTLGHAMWLPQEQMRSHYFAHGDVPKHLAKLKERDHVFLATAGGFTNHLKQPEGLTIQDGTMINAVLQPNRHGLVIMDPQHGMIAFNLKEAEMKLPDGTSLLNPMNDLTAYAQFIDWCARQKATVFQTQLVVHNNRLLIDPEKAVKRFRERRLLALVSNDAGSRHHVLINITEPHMLAPLSAEIFSLLGERELQVDALLNLDVGLYDILDIYDEKGQPISDIKGTSESREATNLIIYSLAPGADQRMSAL